jgi:hypothetical protein
LNQSELASELLRDADVSTALAILHKFDKMLSMTSFAGFRKGRHINLDTCMIEPIKQVSHTRQTLIEYKGQSNFKKQPRVQNRVVAR